MTTDQPRPFQWDPATTDDEKAQFVAELEAAGIMDLAGPAAANALRALVAADLVTARTSVEDLAAARAGSLAALDQCDAALAEIDELMAKAEGRR